MFTKVNFFIFPFQDQATGSDPTGDADPTEGRTSTQSRNGDGVDVSDLPQNQVRRRHRPHLQLLQRQVLREMRRQGGAQIQQGEKPRVKFVILEVYSCYKTANFNELLLLCE